MWKVRAAEPTDVALAVMGSLTLGAFALTESFRELPAAATAYAVAWWVLGLDHGAGDRSGEAR